MDSTIRSSWKRNYHIDANERRFFLKETVLMLLWELFFSSDNFYGLFFTFLKVIDGLP